jgi:hypothetical protein
MPAFWIESTANVIRNPFLLIIRENELFGIQTAIARCYSCHIGGMAIPFNEFSACGEQD